MTTPSNIQGGLQFQQSIKIKNPQKSKNRTSRIKITLQTHDDLLNRLPYEILLEIIGYLLNDDRSNFNEHQIKKIDQGITIRSGRNTTLWVYQHKSDSLILNSLQSLSIINRTIYSILRPILWKSVRFPSQMSTPMPLWNQEILPRQRSYVEALEVNPTREWLKLP